MAYCGSFPGLCGHKADCADKYCPGRQMALDAADLAAGEGALFKRDGGHRVSGDDSLRLHSRPLPPDPAPQEDHAMYFWLAIVFAAFVAAYFQPF